MRTKFSLLLLCLQPTFLFSATSQSSETLRGQKGLFRLMSADLSEQGDYHFRTSLEYFQQDDLLKDAEKSTVRITKGTLAFGYALTSNILLSAHGGFDISSRTPKTVGTSSGSETIDLVKGGATISGAWDVGELFLDWPARRLTAGLAVWTDFSKITRFIEGPNIIPTILASSDFSDHAVLPTRFHLNIGFRPANGARYYKDSATVKDFDRLATQTINDWAITTGLGVEMPFSYINPSVEFHLEKVHDVGFAETPKWVTAGLKTRPFPSKNVEIFAGADIGLSSFEATPTGQKPQAPVVPLWNVIAGFAVGHFGFKEGEVTVSSEDYEKLKGRVAEQDLVLAGLKRDLEYNLVQGQVTDAITKQPLANVTLSFPDNSDLKGSKTDSQGKFVRYFRALQGARLVFSLDGYDSSSKFLALKPGERITVDVELRKANPLDQTGSFVSTITNESGAAVQATLYFLNQQTNQQLTGTSDSNGNVNLKLPQGTYRVEVRASGYRSVTETIEIQRGQTVLRSYSLSSSTNAIPNTPKTP